jgi:hypothetical protein
VLLISSRSAVRAGIAVFGTVLLLITVSTFLRALC